MGLINNFMNGIFVVCMLFSFLVVLIFIYMFGGSFIPIKEILIVVGVIIVAYFIFFRKKRYYHRHHHRRF